MSVFHYAQLLDEIAGSRDWRQDLYNEADQLLRQLPSHRLITGSFNTFIELNAQSNFTGLTGKRGKGDEHELTSLRAELKEYATKLRGGLV